MRFPRYSVFAILAAFFPLAVWAEEPGGGGAQPPATEPAKAPALTQADLDKAVQTALAERDSKWAEQFKTATGHDSLDAFKEAQAKAKGEEAKLIDELKARNTDLEHRYHSSLVNAELRAASGEALDTDVIVALLSGKATVKDGVVTIDGKPAKDAVADLLKAKPHLAKPAGGPGGGAPQNGGGGKVLNRAAFEALSPADRQKHIAGGGTVTD